MDSIYHNIPRFYTAIAEWCACIVYLGLLNKLQLKSSIIFKCMIALITQILFLSLTGNLSTFWWIPSMIAAVLLMYLFLFTCGRLHWKECLYCTTKAFMLAELAASLEWQIHTYLLEIGILWNFVSVLNLILVYFLVFGTMYLLERKQIAFSLNYLKHLSLREVLAAFGCAVVVFSISNMSFVFSDTLFSTHIVSDIYIIRTLIDIIGVAVLYAFQSRLCEYSIEKEMTALQNLINSQYDMYRNYLDSVELIQMKCHDLKHQIAGLRAETNSEKKKEWIDLLEQETEFYEVNVHTGNSVLDAILGAKNLVAKRNQVKITSVVNGQLLNGLHVTDICNIFGNALDNAIENALFIPNEEKRLIHLTVSDVNDLIIIKISNFCEKRLFIKSNSMPETTKSDKNMHGYGLKSIKQSVEKYGGTITIAMNHGWFELKLLIPKQNTDI